MTAGNLLNEISQLSDTLAETEERISELRSQLRTFSEPAELGQSPVDLPADFDPAKANAELAELLRKRLSDSAKYKSLIERHDAARKAETQRTLTALRKRYKEAIIRMLQAGVAFAAAVRDAEGVRSEAFDATGSWQHLRHIGPVVGQWNLWNIRDYTSPLCYWLREAKEHGFIEGNEDWLKGINF